MNPIVSTHSRLKAAGARSASTLPVTIVSTHSRLKAAGGYLFGAFSFYIGFNTQPPEGGWTLVIFGRTHFCSFNTQPPEGGWRQRWRRCWASLPFQHTAA